MAEAAIPPDPQALDGYRVMVGEDEVTPVSKTAIIDRCADSDGCYLRIVFLDNFPSFDTSTPDTPRSMVTFQFGIDSQGDSWSVWHFDGLPLTAGSAADSTEETILTASTSDGSCRFHDTAGRGAFELSGEINNLSADFLCLLRIDD